MNQKELTKIVIMKMKKPFDLHGFYIENSALKGLRVWMGFGRGGNSHPEHTCLDPAQWTSPSISCPLHSDMADELSQATRDSDPMPAQCWPSVVDVGPALNRHWGNVSCLME